MTGRDFMEGHREPPPQPLPRPSIPFGVPADWQPGRALILRPTICCPFCGSVDVKPYDNKVSEGVERWECTNCGQSFKLPRQPRKRCWYPG